MFILEALGAIFSILGALLMSFSTKTNQKPLYYAFISFCISNFVLFAFFLIEGKIPMIIQLIFFFIGAFLGVIKKSANKKRDFKILSIFTILYLIILCIIIYDISISKISFSIVPIDSLAALLAIIGNFLLSSKYHIRRSYAFILFFIADILYVYIGYTNEFYFFMTQSIFFVFTSINGYKNTMKEEIKEFFKNI